MKVAPLTPDEKERLNALYGYEILDTEAEKVFDDLTLMASQICQTPIALISLVDPDRQWFKAKVGLDAQETSRDIAFCAHAIHQREVFEVCDTLKDDRFFDNPLVTDDPNIRFYAGAQLVTPEGYAIGTLCAIDSSPKKLTKEQINSLEILSREVISQLELRAKLKTLEAASRHKTEFLANMSHELRTPVNAILNFSRMLGGRLNKQDQTQDEKALEYVSYIDSASRHLLDMVNSVLDLAKIEQGKMTLNPDRLFTHALFKRVHGIMELQAQEKNIVFEQSIAADLPPCILADETKLRQILLNLLSNAIKFTPPKGHIKTEIDYIDSKMQIKVTDSGCGISRKDQQRLFQKFEQVGQSMSTQGSGLGLNITKGLVELMEGSISLDSKPQCGTSVTVILPVKCATQEAQIPSEQTGISCKADARVLVVEDNQINQRVQMAILQTLGIFAELAETGMKAVDMAHNNQYDIVLMDLHLPDINGEEAAVLINQNCRSLPIVALTADVFYENPKDTVMKEYLTKPLEIERLVDVLNKYVK